MRVLLSAYACDPSGASEAANAWHVAAGLAKDMEVELLTRESNRERVQNGVGSLLEKGATISAHYLSDQVPRVMGGGSLSPFLRYAAWQRRCQRWVRDPAHGPWDVAHHVSWGSATLPIGLRAARCPLVVGPVGGGQRLAPDHWRWFDGPLLEDRLRNISLSTAVFNPWVRRVMSRASTVLATNNETERLLRSVTDPAEVELCLAEGIPDDRVLRSAPRFPEQPEIMWLGRFLPRKSAKLAVRAFDVLLQEHPLARLTFMGDGPTRHDAQSLAHDLRLSDRIQFLGALPWAEAQDVLASSRVHLFTSVRDSSSAQTLEAAALGVPTVSLDLAGASAFLHRPGFLLVDPHPGDDLHVRFAGALAAALSWTPETWERESEGALAFAREQVWSARCDRFREIYASVVSR